MITFKNSELAPALLQVMAYDVKTNKVASGLLTERLPLGLKRNLQKLQAKLIDRYKIYLDDIKTLEKECGEDIDKLTAELQVLNAEESNIDIEPVSLEAIESIETSAIYNFDIIEKFAK